MENEKLENLSYKELVKHLITQISLINDCFKMLDQREVQLQKMTERIQNSLDYKTEKIDFEKLSNKVDNFIASFNVETVRAKEQRKEEKEATKENRGDWKWVAGIIVTALIFAGSQLLQRWPW